MSAITTERERVIVALIERLAKSYVDLMGIAAELRDVRETSKAKQIEDVSRVVATAKLMLLESIRE